MKCVIPCIVRASKGCLSVYPLRLLHVANAHMTTLTLSSFNCDSPALESLDQTQACPDRSTQGPWILIFFASFMLYAVLAAPLLAVNTSGSPSAPTASASALVSPRIHCNNSTNCKQ